MTIALIGGTGFLGTALARNLVTRGIDTLVVARGHHPVDLPEEARFAKADRSDGARLGEIFWRNGVEAVVDIFALSPANTLPVQQAAAEQGASYVLVSSVDVYRNYEGLLKKGSPPVDPAPASETSPLRVMRHPYRGNPRRPQGVDPDLIENYDKIPLEEAAFGNPDLKATSLRLPMIFGAGDKQHRFRWAIRPIASGEPIRIDRRATDWQGSYLYIDDAAEALALAATHPAAVGQVYNVGQPTIRNVRQWVEKLQGLMGSGAPITDVEPGQGGLESARADAADLRYPLTLDSARIRSELGYIETLDEDEALRRTIAWELAAG